MDRQNASYRKKSPDLRRRAFVSVGAVFFAGILIFAAKTAIPFGAAFVLSRLAKATAFTEWQAFLLNTLLYLLLFFPSAFFLLVFLRSSPVEMLREKPGVPRLPFLFIPMVLGLSYGLNLLCNRLFGEWLAPFQPSQTAEDFASTPLGVVLDFLSVGLLPAVVEEWFFRGIVLRKLLPFGKGLAVAASALLFGLMHATPMQSLFATFFGLAAGYAYLKSGSLWFGMLLHFLNNVISTAIGYWGIRFASETAAMISALYVIAMIVFAAITLPFYLRGLRKEKKPPLQYRGYGLRGADAAKAILLNPMLYFLIAGYCFLLWLNLQ